MGKDNQQLPVKPALLAALAASQPGVNRNSRPNTFGRAGGRSNYAIWGVPKERLTIREMRNIVRAEQLKLEDLKGMQNNGVTIPPGMIKQQNAVINQMLEDMAIKDLQKSQEDQSSTVRSGRKGLQIKSFDTIPTPKPVPAPPTTFSNDGNHADDLPDVPDETTTTTKTRRARNVATVGKSANLFYNYNYGGYYNAPRQF